MRLFRSQSKGYWQNSLAVILLVVGLLAGAWIYLRAITPVIGTGYDDGAYVSLARAVAEGKGYRQILLPDAPLEYHYPPGWPVMLGLVWRINPSFPNNADGFKLIATICMFLAMIVYFRWRSWRGDNPLKSALIVLLALFTPIIVSSGTSAFSEAAYTCFSILALWLIERYQRLDKARWLDAMIASLAAAAVVYLRSFAITLVLAAVIYLLTKPNKGRSLAFIGLTVLWIVPWLLWTLHQGGENYSNQLFLKSIEQPQLGYISIIDLVTRFVFNFYAYILRYLPGALFLPAGTPFPGADIVLGVLVLSFLLFTMLKRRSLTDWYVALYLALAFIWPWVDIRLLAPVILLLFGYIIDFFGKAGTVRLNMPKRAKQVVSIASVGLILIFVSVNAVMQSQSAESARRSVQTDPDWISRTHAFEWILSHTNENDVLAAMNDYQVYLYGGSRPVLRDLGSVASLKNYNVKYVVLLPYGGVLVQGDLSRVRFDPVWSAHPTAFTSVYEDQSAYIQILEVDQEALK